MIIPLKTGRKWRMAKEVKEGSARKTGLTPRIAVMFLLHRNRNQCISLEAVLSLAPRGNGSPPRSPRPITTHPRFQSGGVSSAAVDRARVIFDGRGAHTPKLKSVQALHVRIQQEPSRSLSSPDKKGWHGGWLAIQAAFRRFQQDKKSPPDDQLRPPVQSRPKLSWPSVPGVSQAVRWRCKQGQKITSGNSSCSLIFSPPLSLFLGILY